MCVDLYISVSVRLSIFLYVWLSTQSMTYLSYQPSCPSLSICISFFQPLFERAEASSIYRPKKDDSDVYGDVDTQVHTYIHRNIGLIRLVHFLSDTRPDLTLLTSKCLLSFLFYGSLQITSISLFISLSHPDGQII